MMLRPATSCASFPRGAEVVAAAMLLFGLQPALASETVGSKPASKPALSPSKAETFTLSSPDLPAGKGWDRTFIANAFGCTGGNVSPALDWSGAPAGTKSFAVMMFDPHTPPDSGWWHWLVYDLPASTSGLRRGSGSPGKGALLPVGAKQGRPDADAPKRQYYGPCPDVGDPPHPYRITVYALKVKHLGAPSSATAADINYLAISNMLASASITRPHQR